MLSIQIKVLFLLLLFCLRWYFTDSTMVNHHFSPPVLGAYKFSNEAVWIWTCIAGGQGVNLRGLSGIDRDSRGKDGLPSPGFLGLDVSFREGINPAEMMEEWNTMHHLAYIKSCKSWDIYHINWWVSRFSEPSTVCLSWCYPPSYLATPMRFGTPPAFCVSSH